MKNPDVNNKITQFVEDLKKSNINVACFPLYSLVTDQRSISNNYSMNPVEKKDDKPMSDDQVKFINELFGKLKSEGIEVVIESRTQKGIDFLSSASINPELNLEGVQIIFSSGREDTQNMLLETYRGKKIMNLGYSPDRYLNSYSSQLYNIPFFDNLNKESIGKVFTNVFMPGTFVEDLKENNVNLFAISLEDMINGMTEDNLEDIDCNYLDFYDSGKVRVISPNSNISKELSEKIVFGNNENRYMVGLINELSDELKRKGMQLVITSEQYDSVVKQILENVGIKTDNINIVGYGQCKHYSRRAAKTTNVLKDIYPSSNILYLTGDRDILSPAKCYDLGIKGYKLQQGAIQPQSLALHEGFYRSLVFSKIIDLIKRGANDIKIGDKNCKVECLSEINVDKNNRKTFVANGDLMRTDTILGKEALEQFMRSVVKPEIASTDVSKLKDILSELKKQEQELKPQGTQELDTITLMGLDIVPVGQIDDTKADEGVEEIPVRSLKFLSKEYKNKQQLYELTDDGNINESPRKPQLPSLKEYQSNNHHLLDTTGFDVQLTSKLKNIQFPKKTYNQMLEQTGLDKVSLLKIISDIDQLLPEKQKITNLKLENLKASELIEVANLLNKYKNNPKQQETELSKTLNQFKRNEKTELPQENIKLDTKKPLNDTNASKPTKSNKKSFLSKAVECIVSFGSLVKSFFSKGGSNNPITGPLITPLINPLTTPQRTLQTTKEIRSNYKSPSNSKGLSK